MTLVGVEISDRMLAPLGKKKGTRESFESIDFNVSGICVLFIFLVSNTQYTFIHHVSQVTFFTNFNFFTTFNYRNWFISN